MPRMIDDVELYGVRAAYQRHLDRRGPGDLVKADRDAGPNIHMDDITWTVATPEEFRNGMTNVAKYARPQEPYNMAAWNSMANWRYNNRPSGRLAHYDEFEQALAEKMRSDDPNERKEGRDLYKMAYDSLPSERNYKREKTGGKKKIRG